MLKIIITLFEDGNEKKEKSKHENKRGNVLGDEIERGRRRVVGVDKKTALQIDDPNVQRMELAAPLERVNVNDVIEPIVEQVHLDMNVVKLTQKTLVGGE